MQFYVKTRNSGLYVIRGRKRTWTNDPSKATAFPSWHAASAYCENLLATWSKLPSSGTVELVVDNH